MKSMDCSPHSVEDEVQTIEKKMKKIHNSHAHRNLHKLQKVELIYSKTVTLNCKLQVTTKDINLKFSMVMQGQKIPARPRWRNLKYY
jgi:hypothetical protein